MKKKSIITKTLTALITCLLMTVILLTAISLTTFTSDRYYEYEFNKHKVLSNVNGNISMEDAVLVLSNTNEYLKGNSEKLSAIVDIDGQNHDFFSLRERRHLKDVRGLTTNGFAMRNSLATLIAIYFLWFLFFGRKKAREISLTFIVTTIVVNVFAGLLAFFISLDFDKWFIRFHRLLFDNNDWLLNPDQDNLINLLPEAFFVDTALYSLIIYFAIVLLLVGINILIFKTDSNAKI